VTSTPEQDASSAADLLETDDNEAAPVGRLSYLSSTIGLRVAALAGLVLVIGVGLGTDGWGGSTCC
jgi:hypothetical protein